MQFFIFFIALIAALSQTTIAASVSSAAAECGALGVMEVPKDLPEGVDPHDVRKCSEHPDANGGLNDTFTNGTSPSRVHGKLEAPLACETGAPNGCTRGYCWRVCGNGGEWCWTAANGGFGNWLTCSTFRDCDPNAACGQGSCGACGCSC